LSLQRKKSGGSGGGPPLSDQQSAAGTAAAAAAGAARAAHPELHARLDDEAHVGDIDFDGGSLPEKVLFNDDGETLDIEGLIGFTRLIQSQRQSGPASAAWG